MSQILLSAFGPQGQEVAIRMGWDRPLRHFFLDVEDKRWDEICEQEIDEDDQPEDLIFYDSLGRSDIYYAEEVDEILRGLGIELPEHVIADLRNHEEINAGNLVTRWDEPAMSNGHPR